MTKKVAIITGAGRGLGKGLALGLAEFGMHSVLLGRNGLELEETRGEIKRRFSVDSDVYEVDLSDVKSTIETSLAIAEKYPEIHCLVNNAAGWTQGSLDELTDLEISNQIHVTVTANILLAKHLKQSLKSAENPHVINIISTAGLSNAKLSVGGSVAFYAAKYAQAGLGDVLRQEFKFDDIRVCNVFPGGILSQRSYFDSWQDLQKECGSDRMSIKDIVNAVTFALSSSPLCAIDTIVISDRSK